MDLAPTTPCGSPTAATVDLSGQSKYPRSVCNLGDPSPSKFRSPDLQDSRQCGALLPFKVQKLKLEQLLPRFVVADTSAPSFFRDTSSFSTDVAGPPSVEPQLAALPAEKSFANISRAKQTEIPHAPPATPVYERLRTNRVPAACRNLVKSPDDFQNLGHCMCSGSCELNSCINACLCIECTTSNCALQEDSQGRCDNRQFQAAKDGKLEGCVEVFYTGSVKGFGLRAKIAIEKDKLVAEYLGEVKPICNLLTWKYAMLLKNGVAIDASRAGGCARFVNHSCKPNCYAQRWDVSGELRVGLFAARAVEAGEELTFSYTVSGRGGFGPEDAQELCHCGEPGCLGTIGAPTTRPRPPPQTRCPKKRKRVRIAIATAAFRRHKTKVSKSASSTRRGCMPTASPNTCQDITREGLQRPLAALAQCQAIARKEGPFDWRHTRWLNRQLFGVTGGPARCGLEPLLAHPWPCPNELSIVKSAGLYIVKSLERSRCAWVQRVRASDKMPMKLRDIFEAALIKGAPCADDAGKLQSTSLDVNIHDDVMRATTEEAREARLLEIFKEKTNL